MQACCCWLVVVVSFLSWLKPDMAGLEADTMVCNICLTLQYLNETPKNYDRLSKSSAVLQDQNLKKKIDVYFQVFVMLKMKINWLV